MGKKLISSEKIFDNVKLMDSKDIVELVRKYKETEDELLLNKILEQQYKLIMKMARKYYKNGQTITYEFDDLVQEGMIGVLRAIEKFDPDAGFMFSTYSSWWIRQSITRFIASQDDMFNKGMGIWKVNALNKYRKFMMDLSEEEAKTISDEEISKKIDIPLVNIKEFRNMNLSTEVRLDAPVKHDECATMQELFICSDEDQYVETERNELVEEIMTELTDKEKDIILQLFGFIDGEPKTLQYVADQYGVTRERIRQIREKAVRKLRIRVHKTGLKQDEFMRTLSS